MSSSAFLFWTTVQGVGSLLCVVGTIVAFSRAIRRTVHAPGAAGPSAPRAVPLWFGALLGVLTTTAVTAFLWAVARPAPRASTAAAYFPRLDLGFLVVAAAGGIALVVAAAGTAAARDRTRTRVAPVLTWCTLASVVPAALVALEGWWFAIAFDVALLAYWVGFPSLAVLLTVRYRAPRTADWGTEPPHYFVGFLVVAALFVGSSMV